MEHALGSIIAKKYLDIAKEANRGVDPSVTGFVNPLTVDPPHRHSMRSKNETAAVEIRMRDKWIKEKLDEAKAYADKDDCESALRSLGQALHTINDSESPVHTDKNGNPMVWPSNMGKHSPVDYKGIERSKDITQAIYTSQDKRIKAAFEQVFSKECSCREKMKP